MKTLALPSRERSAQQYIMAAARVRGTPVELAQYRSKIILHFDRRPLHAFLPVFAVLLRDLSFLVRVENAAAGGDDCALAIAEGVFGHLGSCALGTVAGEEEDGFGEAL